MVGESGPSFVKMIGRGMKEEMTSRGREEEMLLEML
jgi:hypothetical protein